jgi:hypothetical protein
MVTESDTYSKATEAASDVTLESRDHWQLQVELEASGRSEVTLRSDSES